MSQATTAAPGKLRTAAAQSWTIRTWWGRLFDLAVGAVAWLVAQRFGWEDGAEVAFGLAVGLLLAPIIEVGLRLLFGPVTDNRRLRERISILEAERDSGEKEKREREAIRDRLLAAYATATEQLQRTTKVWEPDHFRDWRKARDEVMREVKDCVGPVVYSRLTVKDHALKPPDRWERQFQTEWQQYSTFVHELLEVIEVYYGGR